MKVMVKNNTLTASKAAHKAQTMPLYAKETKRLWKGNIHILSDGKVYSGLKHTDKCIRLTFRKPAKKK